LNESFKADFKVFGEKLKSLEEKIEGIAKNQAYILERLKKLEERLSKESGGYFS